MKATTTAWLGNRAVKSLQAIAAIMITLAGTTPAEAQVIEEEVAEAIEVIKGKSLYKTPEWAIEVLHNVSNVQQMPMARNTIAMAYLNGIGVKQDSAMAVKYFEEAAEGGYTNAWHNLGMINKNALYGRQDFSKALKYFERGAAKGSLMCSYDAGYMYYKGLGCKQSYKQAVEFFNRGVESGNPSCLYMLGLCYRNGFGVDIDEEKATTYLRKAAQANYRFAIEETLREGAEVQPSVRISESGEDTPESMPEVDGFLDKTKDISGRYTGYLVTYDWSGQQVVREQRLDATFTKVKGSYCGTWVLDTDTIAFYAEITDNGMMTFDNTRILMTDRYTEGKKVEYLFDDALLASLGNSLTGGLRMYSITQKEPQRPMFLSLTKYTSETDYTDNNTCYMVAYPVAGTNTIELRFTLPHEVRNTSIIITSQNGIHTRKYALGELQAGIQRFTITPNLDDGLYIVSMKADELHSQTAIMLKR